MPTQITDNRVNMDKLIEGFATINQKAAIVGVMPDADEKIQVIASANEFGAEIKSPKAILYMRILAKKMGIELKKKGDKPADKIIIPERSYIRSTFDDKEVQNKIIETMRFYLYRALIGKNTYEEILTRAANYLQKQIQARMEGTTPENHPLTEAVKGHTKTLIGKSKKLVASIKSRIVNK